MSAGKLPNWYWLLVGAIVIMPLVGVPALLLVLAPLLSLPFALRRPKLSTE